MSIFFTLIILFGIFLLIVTIAGFYLPTSWTIEKAELVRATPSELFPKINSLEAWNRWAFWATNEESELSFEYPKNKEGLGAVQIWKSPKMNGTLTITQSETDKEIQYQFDIVEGNLTLLGTIVLAPADIDYTQIAWRCQLKKLKGKNPIRRYQALFVKNYFDTAIENSIIRLQETFEN